MPTLHSMTTEKEFLDCFTSKRAEENISNIFFVIAAESERGGHKIIFTEVEFNSNE